MDRRKSIKVLVMGSVSAGLVMDACAPATDKPPAAKKIPKGEEKQQGLMKEEVSRLKEVLAITFFTPHEMQTIAVLSDIILPKDEVSGSATDAGVPDFIEFIVKDKPEHQVPMRGGLRWLDLQCLTRYEKSFVDCAGAQQMEMVDRIAWPARAKPGMEPGVKFFNLMRNLTATGFYTSAIGVQDVGYIGNTPNEWNGVPEDVLKQYDLAYTEKELKECISF